MSCKENTEKDLKINIKENALSFCKPHLKLTRLFILFRLHMKRKGKTNTTVYHLIIYL